MNGIFQNIDHVFNASHPPDAPPPPSNYKTPPASQRVLASLPHVKITADDILEATNKECLICLEEQKIGSWACKLQCGHLFHRNCVAEWLEKHCTCPVCRFELETDDSAYESERKKRMKNRKLRLRMDELNSKSIAQLRELSQYLNIDISGCIDKTEIVEKLVKSGGIEITEGMPPMEMSEEEFYSQTVSQLKFLLLSFGISDRDVIEKSELRSKLLSSGRIVFKPVTKNDGDAVGANGGPSNSAASGQGSYGDVPSSSGLKASAVSEDFHMPGSMEVDGDNGMTQMDADDSSAALQPIDPGSQSANSYRSTQASPSPSPCEPYLVLLSDLRAFTLAELRELCLRYNVSTAGCVEKAELLERLLDSGHIRLLDVQEQLAAVADYSSDMNSGDAAGDRNDSRKNGGNEDNDNIVAEELHLPLPPFGNPIVMDISNTTASNNTSFTGRINAYDELPAYLTGSDSDANVNTQEPDDCMQDTRLTLSVSLLMEMSIREVRSIMNAYNINSAGCLEKTDMIARIRDCSSIRIV